jgi:CheY-like chemotaxis protein
MYNKILCIDDDPITLMLCKKVISKTGFSNNIDTVLNGDEAINYFKKLKENNDDYNLATCFVNLDFKLEALLSWIIFFLANLSIIEITLDNLLEASDLSVANRNALIALRVVLC